MGILGIGPIEHTEMVPLWVHEVRLLVISSGGFCIGLMMVLVPRFLRLAVKVEDELHLLSRLWVVLGCSGIGIVIIGVTISTIARWGTAFNYWKSPLYLVGLLCIDATLVKVAKETGRWSKKKGLNG